LGGACWQYGGGSLAGLKSKERVEVEVEGFRARSTCLGLQVVQRTGFRQRDEKLGHMESLPIVPITHSSYKSRKRLGSKDLKRGQ
jgi:hypothetical protein